ncbi:MAG: RuvX/YqgF family protein [Armatimonadota bacterium]
MGSHREPGGQIVLAIDPGRCKCGVAVVAYANAPQVLHREVVETGCISEIISSLCSRYSVDKILLGDGTTSDNISKLAEQCGLEVRIIDEKLSTVEARKKYFQQNPPRGLRKFIPVSLQTPPEAYDDYVAVILAERYFACMVGDKAK